MDQLSAVDAASASISAGGGAQSYSNRSVSEIRAKITFVEREIARLDLRLGVGGGLSRPKGISIVFNG